MFARGGIGEFLENRDYIYFDLTLEFLNTLQVEVMSWPCCQEGYISFYLDREFYELKLTAFNSVFDFSLSMDLTFRHVANDFNPNAFWNENFGDYWYDTSNSKGTFF